MCAQASRTYSFPAMKRLLSLLAAAGILAVTLFASTSLGSSSNLGAQDSIHPVAVHTNTTVEAAAASLREDTASGADAKLQPHYDFYADRWGIARIGAPDAWLSATFTPALVAVLDTGIAPDTHFKDRLVGAVDFTSSGTTDDEHGHGTHMADTIAGIAPNAQILNAKVADHRGRCDSTTVAQGIRWAADRGAQIINVSLEVAHSTQLEDAVSYAWNKGAVIIVAAGNSGTTNATYPAAYMNTIAVAGTNRDDALAVLSNHGDWVDIAAPGQKIVAHSLEGELTYETGTSPAAAHVSGVAALLFGLDSSDVVDELTNDAVRHALLSSAEGISLSGTGSGLVSAPAAVTSLGS